MIRDIDKYTEQVLGVLMLRPYLLDDVKYNVAIEDFKKNCHKIIFSCIHNLNKIGMKSSIDEHQLLDYMRKCSEEWYQMYMYTSNIEYLKHIKEKATEEDFDYNYNMLKKNTLLKELYDGGWDISRVYDLKGSNKELNVRFESSSIDEILESLFVFSNKLKKKWNSSLNENSEMASSSTDIKNLLESFKRGQTFGIKLSNPVLNSISKGARQGKVLLFGASSGVGKTRTSVMNACDMAIPFKLNPKTNNWEVNGKHEKVLFITTELLLDEVQTMILSCVSKIDENKLNYSFNELTTQEISNLNKAVGLIENFPINICHLPNYDLNDLEIIIEEYVLNHNIRYIYFDYIHLTGKIMEQLKGIREDLVILQIMTSLKNIANKYGCFIWVGSQLNRSASDVNNKDTFAVFRSAFSIGDKVDIGIATTKATNEDVDELCEKLKSINSFTSIRRPNLVNTIIKNRGGQNSIRIWTYFNHGTLTEEVVAVTDLDNNLISIDLFNQEQGQLENANDWLGWLNQ